MKHFFSSRYSSFEDRADELPQLFKAQKGELLHKGRNEIRLFLYPGNMSLVVKKFKKTGFIKSLFYALSGRTKARKAFANAEELLRRGIDTPFPAVCSEVYRCGLVGEMYYVCEYTQAPPLKDFILKNDLQAARAFGIFVAELHRKGVIHPDLNNTNVLCTPGNDGYCFSIIDTNRIRFVPSGTTLPLSQRLENLTLFADVCPFFIETLRSYIQAANLNENVFEDAMTVKRKHDARWRRKKRMGRLFKFKKH